MRLPLLVAAIVAVALSYIATFLSVSALYRSPLNPLYDPTIGVDPTVAPFLAIPLLVLPYTLGGALLEYRVHPSAPSPPLGLVTA